MVKPRSANASVGLDILVLVSEGRSRGQTTVRQCLCWPSHTSFGVRRSVKGSNRGPSMPLLASRFGVRRSMGKPGTVKAS